jgi:protein-S-isoprenylcysteine O-methyltransferase Ste14
MSPETEDRIGKALMLLVFGALALRQGRSFLMIMAAPERPPVWLLIAAGQFVSLVFVAFVLLMTLRRLPPRQSAAGIEPRVTAIAGTFALMLLVWLPPGGGGPMMKFAALILMLIGTIFSIYCLHYLGRSFSIMASARELVTHGPYGVVRHPLYLAEGISTVGVILLNWSIWAVMLGLVQMALQFRRMLNEEKVLRAAFPEYADYAARVPMIVPGLRRQGVVHSTNP